jgi:hypothetical protein
MQIIENRALQIVTRKAAQITALIPKSKVLAQNGDKAQVLVNWGVDEWRVLRNLGFTNAPHPILGRYKWPGVYTPFDHQRTTSAFMASNPRCFVFNEQGTGKSASVAWAADYLMKKGIVSKVLIVCPVSIMDTAWRSDLFKTLMHRSVGIAQGTRQQRQKVVAAGYEFTIINFDGVKVVRKELEAAGFDLIVVDESSQVKTATTDRWKALASLIKPTTWVWSMTGTPAAQSPLDAYGLAKLVNPKSVPAYFSAWRDQTMIKITDYKWVPKMTAIDSVSKVLQPAIRFTKAECLDLPEQLITAREVPLTAQQTKYYEQVRKQMMMVASGEVVTAVNAAALVNKLLQISCIAYNTPVLTNSGWVPIQEVTADHLVWDGQEWVSQQGAVRKGVKSVVSLAGVRMTPDHKVWTNDGWKEANEILNAGTSRAGSDWAEVWLPGGFTSSALKEAWHASGVLGVQVPVRECGVSTEPIPTQHQPQVPSQLRMLSRKHNPRNVHDTPIQQLDGDDSTVYQPPRQGLQKLWGSGHHCLREVGAVVREFLGRHVRGIRAWTNDRSGGCERKLHQGELPVGDEQAAGQQQTDQRIYRDSKGAPDDFASCGSIWIEADDSARPDIPLQVVAVESADHPNEQEVFDLINCGPRNRFVVRGETGECLIVHNCGAAYTDSGDVVEFDISHRLSELMDIICNSLNKVLVFVPFRHIMERLEVELNNLRLKLIASNPTSYEVAHIHGGTPAGKRAEIIKAFQTEDTIRILLLQPQAAAHGITLTRADQVVWWGPTTSAETYLQANARAHRAGQVNKVTVTHLQGSPVERRTYAALQGNVDRHLDLVSLYKQEIT